MPRRDDLLRILSDRRFHSGEALGRELGVSRAAVWKQLRALGRQGIQVDAVPGRGYRLATRLDLLDRDAVLAAMPAASRSRLAGLELHQELDSTNSELLRRLSGGGLPAPYACLAEAQTAGRGRHNRSWRSPYGRNLYLSLAWRFPDGSDSAVGLSLATGVAVMRALSSLGLHDARLKWPNDVVWRSAKLAGVLIEMRGEAHGPCCAVIGVGVNVDMSTVEPGIDQPWTDVATALGGPVSRNRLAAMLIHHMTEALEQYAGGGLGPFLDEWRRHDMLLGRAVRLSTSRGEQAGIARGIDPSGALLVEHDGRVERYLSGDVSLRPAHASTAQIAAQVGT